MFNWIGFAFSHKAKFPSSGYICIVFSPLIWSALNLLGAEYRIYSNLCQQNISNLFYYNQNIPIEHPFYYTIPVRHWKLKNIRLSASRQYNNITPNVWYILNVYLAPLLLQRHKA